MDGVVGLKVLNARAIFGSPLADATRPFSTLPISAGSRPSRFWSWYSKPPPVLRPMIGGRLNGKAMAERMPPRPRAICPISTCTLSAAALRSANGLRRSTMNAALDWLPLSSKEKPTMASTFWICGMPLAMASTRVTTSRVRVTLAPSGNCTATKNAPWSSSGRKPVGVRSARP